jgi:hypothetical protein
MFQSFHSITTFSHVQKITMWCSIFFTSSNILDMIQYIPKIFYLCDNIYSKKIPLGSHVYYSHSCAHELINVLTFTTFHQTNTYFENAHSLNIALLFQRCKILPTLQGAGVSIPFLRTSCKNTPPPSSLDLGYYS